MASKYVSPSKLTLAVNKLKDLISAKVNKTGDTMTGDLVVGSSKIGSNGYVEGTWLRSTNVTNKGSQTGKIAVIDSSGWIYYRTPEEIKAETGIPDVILDVTVEGNMAIFYSGADVQNNLLIVG